MDCLGVWPDCWRLFLFFVVSILLLIPGGVEHCGREAGWELWYLSDVEVLSVVS